MFFYVFQSSSAPSACVLLVVSLYFGSSKMVFSLVQVVELGCLLLFQVAFMCIDFFW